MSQWIDVSEKDEEFRNVRTDDSDNVPDGEYRAILDDCQFRRIGKSNELIFEWTMVVSQGEFENSFLKKLSFLRNKDQLRWFKVDISKMEIPCDDLSTIQKHAEELRGVEVEVKVSHSEDGERQYVNIGKRLWASENGKPKQPIRTREEPPPPTDNDLPF